MTASISTTGNVPVGPIAGDWTAQLDAVPHSPLQSNGSTGQINFNIPAFDRAHLLMNNAATFNYSDPATNTAQLTSLIAGTTYTAANPVFSSAIPGVIDSVTITNPTASCTMGTPYTQFATTDIDIPWVSSGSVLGAFDLAWQLAGNDKCTRSDPNGHYWSLVGHDIGFDYTNKVVYSDDRSYYDIDPYIATQVVRIWDCRTSYFGFNWAVTNNLGLCSQQGEGSSVSVAAGTRTSIAFTIDGANANSFNFAYGNNYSGYDQTKNGYSEQWGFGPLNMGGSLTGKQGTGKTVDWTFNFPTKTASVSYFYYTNASGSWGLAQPPTATFSLSTLDFTKNWKVVTDTAYPSSTSFQISIWVQAADGTGPVVTWTSGVLSNTVTDIYSIPWSHNGPIRGLYQITSPMSFDPSTLLANYEVATPVDATAYGNQLGMQIQGSYPVYEPIAPYTGTLWDYLSQVCCAKQVDLRLAANGQFFLTDMSIQDTQLVNWAPAQTPTVSIDNSNTATTIEVDAQLMSLQYQPKIYDARTDSNQVYSISAGQTTTLTISGNFTGSVVYNPCPFYDYASFNTSNRFGAFVVSGADNLPIKPTQWVAGGGRVYAKQTGPSTIEVTVICPNIVDANGDGSNVGSTNYYFGLSDGQNQHGCFVIAGGAGSPITQKNFTFQTGASYTAGNASAGAISNPCATSMRMVNTLAGWASAIATGPNLTLTATVPTEHLALIGITRVVSDSLGQLPGKRLLYRNMSWRIMSATLHTGGVDITCAADVTYLSNEWNANWSSKTVDQYTAYWANCTYDDLNTMMLAGPVNNWDNTGALPPTSTALGIAQDVRD